MPISFKELEAITQQFKGTTLLGGSAGRYGLGQGGGRPPQAADSVVDYAATKDVDAFMYDFLHGTVRHRRRMLNEWQDWSVQGANITTYHPDFPQPLMAEIETYRGCCRFFTGGCSFCIEPSFGVPAVRPIQDIICEVKALYGWGVRNFRLGGQSCFFSYGAQGIGMREIPRPDPSKIHRLLSEIRRVAPNLQVLHIDNVNPAVVAKYPAEARDIAAVIVKYCTAGNTAALGLESADEQVRKENNLNATPDQARSAIALINEVGKKRGLNGMPCFLPGINLLAGLPGERKRTYAANLQFLQSIKNEGLLLRRVNIRQVLPLRLPQTAIHKGQFQRFKRAVNEIINKPMLQQMVPTTTILKNVLLEIHRGNRTFGRQVGSYPLLICLPYVKNTGGWTDVKILDHGYRSVTGIEFPLNINTASLDALAQLPTVGVRRAARIIRHRPFSTCTDLQKVMDTTFDVHAISSWVSFT
jgi:radical SAM superfamily enzyme with C-terminal helix-hairpin-helix motif